ncbi:unnamed protein product, partial [Rotaria sp. Silwood1]
DRKASFSTESDPTAASKWQLHNSTLALRNKSKTLDYKTKSNLVSQTVKTPRTLTHHQTNCKQRSGMTNHPSTHRTTT